MDYICQDCDREIIESEEEYQYYLSTVDRKKDRKLYTKYIIINISFDDLDKVLNDYITTHNKKFDFYLIRCELIIEFDNNLTEKIKTKYFYTTSINDIKRDLL